MAAVDQKRMLGHFWRFLPRDGSRRVILLYHSVGNSPWAVPEESFRAQMAWLDEHACVVPIERLVEESAAEGLRVSLTFDDGYASLIDTVAPVLASYGMTASVYLNTGLVKSSERAQSDPASGQYPDEQLMSWVEIQALSSQGWGVGSHGVGHLDLTRASGSTMERELRLSKSEIESRLGRPCEYFAYTWGRFNGELRNAARIAGYSGALSGIHGAVKSTSDRLALPRIDIRAEYGLRDFEDVVVGRWDFLGLKQRLARVWA